MSSAEATYLQEEAAALQRKIQDLVKETQQKSVARRQEENLFVLSAAHEKGVRDSLRHSTASHDVLSKLLHDIGEEDLVEEECLGRYKAFLQTKAAVFNSAATEIEELGKLFSSQASDGEKTNSQKNIGHSQSMCTNSVHEELHDFDQLWQEIKCLQRVTGRGALEKYVLRFSGEHSRTHEEEQKLLSFEKVLAEAMAEQENLLLAVKRRVAATEFNLSALIAKQKIDADDEKSAVVKYSFVENESAVASAKNALEVLRSSLENSARRRKVSDSATAALHDKLTALAHHVDVCRKTRRDTSASTTVLEKSADQLSEVAKSLAEQLRLKERQCSEEEQLLIDEEASYAEVKEKATLVADDEETKAAELNNAELEHKKMCVAIEAEREQILLLKSECAELEEELEVLRSEKDLVSRDVSYLGNLVSDKSSVGTILSNASGELQHTNTPLATRSYLHFVQKARDHQRSKLNAA